MEVKLFYNKLSKSTAPKNTTWKLKSEPLWKGKSSELNLHHYIGGGFQICFILTPGEMIQLEEHMFQTGWNRWLWVPAVSLQGGKPTNIYFPSLFRLTHGGHQHLMILMRPWHQEVSRSCRHEFEAGKMWTWAMKKTGCCGRCRLLYYPLIYIYIHTLVIYIIYIYIYASSNVCKIEKMFRKIDFWVVPSIIVAPNPLASAQKSHTLTVPPSSLCFAAHCPIYIYIPYIYIYIYIYLFIHTVYLGIPVFHSPIIRNPTKLVFFHCSHFWRNGWLHTETFQERNVVN